MVAGRPKDQENRSVTEKLDRREDGRLTEVVALLKELKVGIEGLRRQFAGGGKTHFTVNEIARFAGRAPFTVRTWIKSGQLRATRVEGSGPRGRLLIPREELQRLVATGRGRNVPAAIVGEDGHDGKLSND